MRRVLPSRSRRATTTSLSFSFVICILGSDEPIWANFRKMKKKKMEKEEDDNDDKNTAQVIYHEKQRLQFCLLHALNNLFQEKGAFSRTQLNAISEKLSLEDPNKEGWTPLSVIFKPHHNALTGNYDVNVLFAALEERGKRVAWHDKRSGASSMDLDEQEGKLMGILLNIPVKRFGGLMGGGRHWVALKKIGNIWYNLDSDFAAPYAFKDTEEMRYFLDAITNDGAEILLVMNDNQSLVLMSAKAGGTESDANGKTVVFNKQNSANKSTSEKKFSTSCRFRTPTRSELSPLRFLRRIGDKVASALQFISCKRKRRRRSCGSVNSNSAGRSNPSIAPIDSQRAEAISDCIEFMVNSSSSSLQRSNSVSITSS
ncbi:josephin-like protein [Diospyros lotus]|uniref:josephin-like protein n=1 Tax=Diospyros lotus TaxID=55363 RepID=UPI0022538767|nr:josephin-like protein [Diospyros lotus]